MNTRFTGMSDRDLIAEIVGKRAARKFNAPLRSLFEDAESGHPKCLAARELVRRWLGEELRHDQVFNDPNNVRDYLRVQMAGREHEVFTTLFLDAQHRLIACEELFRGTLTQTSVYPREVLKAALKHNAAAVIFAHNHPSGVAQPSKADELLTTNLKATLAMVDVKVLDHFVVGGASVVSFAEKGLL